MAGTTLRDQKVTTLITADGTRHVVTQQRNPSETFPGPFMIIFTESMKIAARRIESGTTLRVLLALPEHLDFVTFRHLPREPLAAELKISGPSVSRAMTELEGLGIVEREGRGPVTKWRMSSDWGWRNNAGAHARHRGGKRPIALKGALPPQPAESRRMYIMERNIRRR